MPRHLLMAAVLTALVVPPALAQRTPAPADAEVYIIRPDDGAAVSNPVTVVFGARNIGVAPAGIDVAETGHHHLLVDIAPDEIDLSSPLPATEQIIHFGGGRTQTTIELEPGTHTLRLLMADEYHVPHEPPLFSQPVTVTVEP